MYFTLKGGRAKDLSRDILCQVVLILAQWFLKDENMNWDAFKIVAAT